MVIQADQGKNTIKIIIVHNLIQILETSFMNVPSELYDIKMSTLFIDNLFID